MIAKAPPTRPREILLVEDSETQARLAQHAFRASGSSSRLRIARDGEEALSHLEHAADEPPDLVLLDLHMPKKSGWDVLREMKTSDRLRRIPVLLMTTSDDERDVEQAYDCYANSFVAKPTNLAEYVQVLRSIERFWFHVATVPSRC